MGLNYTVGELLAHPTAWRKNVPAASEANTLSEPTGFFRELGDFRETGFS
jgi:hypothetical protein